MKAGFIATLFYGLALLAVGVTPTRAQVDGKPLWQPFYISPHSGAQHISLNGKWELGYRDAPITRLEELRDQREWIATQVPSSVQWALYRAGKLPHPYLHMNARQYDWVVEKVWYYRKTFPAPSAAKGQYVFLCFDGIDYYARIWLNGQELGRHEGMYSGPMVEVSSLLRSDAPNEIIVEVRAANYGVGDKWKPWVPGKVTASWGVTGGLGLITGGGGRTWGPEGTVGGSVGVEDYFPVGMWRGVRMEIVPHIHLERPFLVTRTANDQEAELELTTEILVNTNFSGFQLHLWKGVSYRGYRNAWTSTPVQLPLRLQVRFIDKDTSRTVLSQGFALKIYEGRNWAQQKIKLLSPKLWWPNGMGDPHLYTVKLSLEQQGKPIDAMEFDYGIRTIRNIPSAGPRTGDRWNGWQFVVNGRKFFVKGMDWWTTDILLDLPRDRYEWILGTARAGGIQMLRTWGAGILETDDFYDLCNKLGIMI
jgi:beta-mannosidase